MNVGHLEGSTATKGDLLIMAINHALANWGYPASRFQLWDDSSCASVVAIVPKTSKH